MLRSRAFVPAARSAAFSTASVADSLLLDAADLRKPQNWFPAARAVQRRFVLHVGPTNSGKTWNAMQALQAAPSGVYCGPLRLLAWEVASRLREQGILCDLVTGQEVDRMPGAAHTSSTMEMADLSEPVACAVLDEVQMLGDDHRGWAWTRVLLGMPAEEVHACGDESSVDLLQRLCEQTGEEVEVRRYERLSPLRAGRKHVRSLEDIRKGDCIVAFGRKQLYQLKRDVELACPGTRACIVYGGLPPEARKQQAALFNDPRSGCDVLIASDAIGMGLNLNIQRIIFSTLSKFDGVSRRPLTDAEIKQIAGRAGRYVAGAKQAAAGEATCMDANDLPRLAAALKAPLPPLEAAGLFPSAEQVELYAALPASAAESRPFGELLDDFMWAARLEQSLYFVSNMEEVKEVAALLSPIPMPLRERYTWCMAPVDTSRPTSASALQTYAAQWAHEAEVPLGLRIPGRLPRTPGQLYELEGMHNVLDLYLWLSRRYPDEFYQRSLAEQQRNKCVQLIEAGLAALSPRRISYGNSRRPFRPPRRASRRASRQAEGVSRKRRRKRSRR